MNIAARIESFAVPGGVMLSDSAYDQIKNRSDIGVVGLGRFRLKNVGRPLELYAISAATEKASGMVSLGKESYANRARALFAYFAGKPL